MRNPLSARLGTGEWKLQVSRHSVHFARYFSSLRLSPKSKKCGCQGGGKANGRILRSWLMILK